MLSRSEDSSRANTALRALVLSAILVFAGVVVVVNVPWQGALDKNALSQFQVETGHERGEAFSPADLSMWQATSEDKFRALMTQSAAKQHESRFVERLVSEWKLSRSARGKVRADSTFTVNPGHCSPLLGGNGGSYSGYHDGSVRVICGRTGSLVDRIDVTFNDNHVLRAGGQGGSGAFCFQVPAGQCITRVNIRSGSLVDGFQFITDGGLVSPWYGGHGGSFHTIIGQGCLGGVNVRAGSLIDALSFCF